MKKWDQYSHLKQSYFYPKMQLQLSSCLSKGKSAMMIQNGKISHSDGFCMGPSVESDKLIRYIGGNSAYSIQRKGNEIEVHYTPDFPEAMGHLPNGEPVEHIMSGREENGRIYFHRFTTVSSFGTTSSELDDEDDPIMEWINYI